MGGAIVNRAIQDVTSFIFMRDEPQLSDVIFVPGTAHAQISETAARLYHQGYAPYILPSGRFSSKLGRFASEKVVDPRYMGEYATDFEYCRHVLIVNGVPDSAILREDESANTMENAAFSARALRKLGIDVKHAILCCQAFHARRAFMSYACHFPGAELRVVPTDTQGITAANWFMSEKSCKKVLGEVAKCGAYFVDFSACRALWDCASLSADMHTSQKFWHMAGEIANNALTGNAISNCATDDKTM